MMYEYAYAHLTKRTVASTSKKKNETRSKHDLTVKITT